MEWRVRLSGNDSDLEELSKSFDSDKLRIWRDEGNYILSSSDFAEITAAEIVLKKSLEILASINVGSKVIPNLHEPIGVSGIESLNENAKRTQHLLTKSIPLTTGVVNSSILGGDQVRHFEFQDYLIQLLTLNENFRNITMNFPLGRESRLQADISAEEKVNDRWQHIIIECKSTTTFTLGRLNDIIVQLKQYQSHSPTSKLILAFPGRLSAQASQTLKNVNIEIWDLSYLSNKFVAEIPKVRHPILQSLLSGVRLSLTKSPEEKLIDKLDLCKPGKSEWVSYQNLVGSILEQLFCPPLSNIHKEHTDAYAINRRDFIIPNYVEGGFWAFLRSQYSADYIVVDAKNYAGKVKKEQVLQIANYIKSHGTGLFGLIVCRNGGDRSCALTLREVWSIERKLIIVLTDYDLKEMLTTQSYGGKPETIIRQRIEDFRLEI